MYKEMHEILNEGQIGKFKLDKFEITPEIGFTYGNSYLGIEEDLFN